MNEYNFQVHLHGMIDLLSNHLYSTPQVFIRELLQNAVDAITARKKLEPFFEEKISLEVYHPKGAPPTLYIEDNGIGLTESEIHECLAKIGQSSKSLESDEDFIGRFGVGLLSCFIVSDEIVLITRSINSDETIEWRGKSDGRYQVRKLEQSMSPGTRIYIQGKEGFERYFSPNKIIEYVKYYGEFLPYPIYFYGDQQFQLNTEIAPWDMKPLDALIYGKSKWGIDFIDAIPLYSEIGEAKGIAYILPYAVNLQSKRKHRVYVKQMLLSEKVEKIMPDWSFFVTCIINVNHLRPTASREDFYEDALLDIVKQDLGNCIKQYLRQLAKQNSPLLRQIIRVHYSSLKLLALEDDELYRLFIDWLPFETSLGQMTMGEIRQQSQVVYYTPSVDEFRQIRKVAKAQSCCVINGGYMNDVELIEKLKHVFPDTKVERIDPSLFLHGFTDLTLDEREQAHRFIKIANETLKMFRCSAEMKKFQPYDLPALYTTSEEGMFLRMAEQSKEQAHPMLASIIEQVATKRVKKEIAQLCFNYENPIIQKAINIEDENLCRLVVEMLYVQSLLLGHYPLRQHEMSLLNNGLIHLMERSLNNGGTD